METLEAKLRNQLTPLYGLCSMVEALEDHYSPELLKIVIECAKQASHNQKSIDMILEGIEAKTENKPDVIRKAFFAGKQEEDDEAFDCWIKNKVA